MGQRTTSASTRATVHDSAVVVAHPDDETIWAGGLMLMNRQRRWRLATLCRASDPDRAPRFARAAAVYGGVGDMADLDDEPDQMPLEGQQVQETVLRLLGARPLDVVLTHSPRGEYTRHRRHEEAGRALLELWEKQSLTIRQLWVFAYEDGGRSYLPRARADAHWRVVLPEEIWRQKRAIVTDIYGFAEDSFETRTTPRTEAFWVFGSPMQMRQWMSMESGDA